MPVGERGEVGWGVEMGDEEVAPGESFWVGEVVFVV